MSLRDDQRTAFNLINLTHKGISVAEYPQVRSAVVERFKQIYGSDIDLSTGSADGVYCETFSLIINNVLQTLKMLYGELDINTATGIFLDSLCALTGIYRKSATKSSATLSVRLTSDTAFTIDNTHPLSFVDKAGTVWSTNIQVGESVILQPNAMQDTILVVFCNNVGPVKAPIGWINRLVSNDISLTISQTEEAEVGTYNETDAQLRNRRNQSMSTKGISVLESLAGTLLNITGIEDIKIYNNNTNSNITANDTTVIVPHQVYVVIRKNKNVIIDDSLIGSYIYEKMTPGIGTAHETPLSVTGTIHSYQYTQYILGVSYSNPSLLQNVYWKEASPINTSDTTITFVIKKDYNFASYGNETYNLILVALQEYLNNLELSASFSVIDLINQINDTDPMFRGRKTYNCTSAFITDNREANLNPIIFTGSGLSQQYTLKDTYFDFTNATIQSITPDTLDNNIVTVVIGITSQG